MRGHLCLHRALQNVCSWLHTAARQVLPPHRHVLPRRCVLWLKSLQSHCHTCPTAVDTPALLFARRVLARCAPLKTGSPSPPGSQLHTPCSGKAVAWRVIKLLDVPCSGQVEHDLDGAGLCRTCCAVKGGGHVLWGEAKAVRDERHDVHLLAGQQVEAERILHSRIATLGLQGACSIHVGCNMPRCNMHHHAGLLDNVYLLYLVAQNTCSIVDHYDWKAALQ